MRPRPRPRRGTRHGRRRRWRVPDLSRVRTRLRRGWRSERHCIGLRRDLREAFEAPPARVRLALRPAVPEDRRLLEAPAGTPAGGDPDRIDRLRRFDSGLPGCHVATVGGEPCYVQWLLTPEHNRRLRRLLGPGTPRLAAGTVLLDGAYTPPRHRRLAVMPAAMAMLAERAGEAGARRAVVFVEASNASMLEACRRAGFRPFVERTVRWRRFVPAVAFAPVPRAAAQPARSPPTWRSQRTP